MRFLDDVFLVWLHGEEALREFLVYVNSYHSTTKYTWEWYRSRLSYLDVLVSLSDGEIGTDVYSKLTDTHQYLDDKSCHPEHVKRGIPYGQALREKDL